MKNLRSMLLITLSIGLLAACKKNDSEPSPNPEAKIKQIYYSDTDKQFFAYNDKGLVSTYTSQWQFIQNDPTSVKSVVYQFTYDENNKLIKTTVNEGFEMKYYYQNGLISKVEEIDSKGRVQVTRNYTISNQQVSKEEWEIKDWFTQELSFYKKEYLYDAKGNMNKISEYYKESAEDNFALSSTTEISGFDDKINPDNALQYPFLQNVVFFKNNPGKSVYKSANGTVISTTNYAYEYNAKGLPIKKTTTDAATAAELKAQYTYIE